MRSIGGRNVPTESRVSTRCLKKSTTTFSTNRAGTTCELRGRRRNWQKEGTKGCRGRARWWTKSWPQLQPRPGDPKFEVENLKKRTEGVTAKPDRYGRSSRKRSPIPKKVQIKIPDPGRGHGHGRGRAQCSRSRGTRARGPRGSQGRGDQVERNRGRRTKEVSAPYRRYYDEDDSNDKEKNGKRQRGQIRTKLPEER